jgi:5'-deoxynucleotidase YfbR-like HD superfamily hydrolase
MQLNIRELVDGNPTRLRDTFRYSTSRIHHPESVAEHSYYVALYCMLVGRWANEHFKVDGPLPAVNLATVLQKALVHDLEEARSGDFPRPFKNSTPELRHLLEVAAAQAYNQVLMPLFNDQSCADSDILQDFWTNSKDDTREGMVLEFCDFLSVLSFMLQEREAGNKLVRKHVAEMDKYFLLFENKKFDFIRPLVLQTRDLMFEVFHA